MSNIVENNNNFTEFNQVWSKYVFVDAIPESAPDLSEARESFTGNNPDRTSNYTVYVFQKTEHENTYDYLIYLSNFQLTKEFRQGRSWKLEFNNDEETLRNVILPSMTVSRDYTPSFSDGEYLLQYTSVDPDFNFNDCRLEIGLDLDKLYFSGWIYIGKNLQETLQNYIPPFDDRIWLLKNKETGNKASLHVTDELEYELPPDNFTGTEDSHTLLSTNILNQALDKFGVLDEGEYW